MPRGLTTKEFIERAREVHGDRYDYSLVKYVNYRTKIKIICSQHGEFEQSPGDHYSQGSGCLACGRVATTNANTFDTSQFIERAREVHGDRYDYSLVKYVNTNTNIKIICSQHGEFTQRPDSHTSFGSGCPICGVSTYAEAQAKTTQQFIRDARKMHGDTYDYSKVDYVNAYTKVTIVCSQHGEFVQEPASHANQGVGCPICGAIKSRKNYYDVPTILYYLKIDYRGKIAYKIGITSKSVKERYAEDLADPNFKLEILEETMFENGKPAYEAEQELIKRFEQFRYKGEYELLFGGNSELFDRDIREVA